MSAKVKMVQNRIAGAAPFFHEDDIPQILARLEAVLRGGRLIFGDNTNEFEEQFRSYIGTHFATSVNSCTAALEITLRFFDVHNREVIVPTNTFASVIMAIIYAGGIPVMADMDPRTFCLDIDDALSRINSQTAGIIVVHIAGLVDPSIDHLCKVARECGLFLIEDASHAHGAMFAGRRAGSLTDAGCFSFYPTKVMTTGTGGMITTNNPKLAAYAQSVRHHGQGQSLENIVNLGNDWCMSELSAVLGLYQLKRLDAAVQYRNQVVEWYRRELADVSRIEIPKYSDDFYHAYYKVPVLLDPTINKRRLRQLMFDEYEIELGSLYDPPCHLQPIFRQYLGCSEGMYPRAEETLRRQICLPIHVKITEDDVNHTAVALKQAFARSQ